MDIIDKLKALIDRGHEGLKHDARRYSDMQAGAAALLVGYVSSAAMYAESAEVPMAMAYTLGVLYAKKLLEGQSLKHEVEEQEVSQPQISQISEPSTRELVNGPEDFGTRSFGGPSV